MTPQQERHVKIRRDFAEFIKCYPFTPADLEGEQWAPIEGPAGYQVSNYGRVKSFRQHQERILRPLLNQCNYLVVHLWHHRKMSMPTVHQLVAKAFIPNPENKPEVNHKDGCKFNSVVSNLEWVTHSENQRHAVATGLQPILRGGDNGHAVLTNGQAKFVRENPNNLTGTQLAALLSIGQTTVSAIQTGKRYKEAGGTARKPRKHMPPVSEDIRVAIRAEYQAGVKGYGCQTLARKYGYNKSTILNIVKEDIRAKGGVILKGKQPPRVSKEIRAQIRAEYIKKDKEHGALALAKKYGISRNTVTVIVNEK